MSASPQISPDMWLQALRYGLVNGRPYSDNCINLYRSQIQWFFRHYGEVSVHTLKLAMLSIPIENFAKRARLFDAILCYAKYLEQEGVCEKGFVDKLRPYKPRRHLPPKKLSVDEANIEKLLTY